MYEKVVRELDSEDVDWRAEDSLYSGAGTEEAAESKDRRAGI